MSSIDRERLRDCVRDLLDFQPEERVPCTQVLGIGLTREICEKDTSLKRWLVCQAVEFVVEREMGVEEALAAAFGLADDQCEHFDLALPGERPTSFGPLEAQVERQQRLGDVRESRPERARTGRGPARADREREQRPLTGTEPEQRGLTGEPAPERPVERATREEEPAARGAGAARLSEFFVVHNDGSATGIRGPFADREGAAQLAADLGPYHVETREEHERGTFSG